jgi:hypothetical protein
MSATGRRLASRAVIVNPEKRRRRSEPVADRGGPTGLQHRSDQLAAPDVVEAFGWHTSRPPLGIRFATFFVQPDGLTSRPAARDVFPLSTFAA